MDQRPFANANRGPGGYGSVSGSGGDLEAGFDEKSRQISTLIFKINSNANSLQKLSGKVGSGEDSEGLRRKIQTTQRQTNEIAFDVPNRLNDLAAIVGGDRSRRLQNERLRSSFKSAVERYCSIQMKTAEKLKATITIRQPESGLGGQDPEDPWSDRDRLVEREQKREQLQQQALHIEDEVAYAHEREKAIRQLEEDILDVNVIFRDLAVMVEDQGVAVDSIENHVILAADQVEAGREELVKARTYQRSARKKKCICALILLIILIVIAIILGVVLSKKK